MGSLDSTPGIDLAEISTRWTSIQEPDRFVLRYSPAILAYLIAILRNEDDARDVAQDFFIKFVERGLPRASQDRGRFRDYLKVAVRNAALSHLRKKRSLQSEPEILAAIPDQTLHDADLEMIRAWKKCVLDKLWRSLESHQRRNPGNYCYDVLRVSLDYPEEDSEKQAEIVSRAVGHQLSPAAFRKQRSRARQTAAEILRDEVRSTLEFPTPEELEAELADLELLELLRDYLTESDA